MSNRASRSVCRFGVAFLFSVATLALGCEAEQGMKSPPIIPGKGDADTASGTDVSSVDVPPGSTDGSEADASSPPDDTGGAPLTCEDLSLMFVKAISENSAAYTTCTAASDCQLITPRLECKDSNVLIKDCPFAVTDPLKYATSRVDVTKKLCALGVSDCIATPGCPAAHEACSNGRCVAELDEP